MQKIDEITDWGIIPYAQAWEKQQQLFNETINRKTNKEKNLQRLILCQHPHVITLGKSGNENNLLLPEQLLKEKDVEYFHIDREGDITYHGPGQLVVYPIFDLDAFGIGLKTYIQKLEEVIIRLLGEYGIKSGRMSKATGVWLDIDHPRMARKICAIGVRSSRFVTMHGLALNVNTDLSYFSLINPCGFMEKGVTSMRQELNVGEVDMEIVKNKLIGMFHEVFAE
ncbi:MAG: lipoyl(octanoyl) transferase LipB [Petrimonas sp.]|nr:lipoyl(octanoyl) transferase LipB [Petrimonas sp.]